MSIVKSFSVGEGDMFYVKHNSDNFTTIDCCLSDDNADRIISEFKSESSGKGITRFISTHPDEDHIQNIAYLDSKMPIANFYCVANQATKSSPSDSFKHYCSLRDGAKAYLVEQGSQRKWMNLSDDERKTAGLTLKWPKVSNADYKDALENARYGNSFNTMSLAVQYSIESGAKFLWLGDLETSFMEAIEKDIVLEKTHVVFAAHHGRKTGKIPDSWLDKLDPDIIVIGEAKRRHLHHYSGYDKITQSKAGDITFDCDESGKIHIYASNKDYSTDFLSNKYKSRFNHYIGTFNL